MVQFRSATSLWQYHCTWQESRPICSGQALDAKGALVNPDFHQETSRVGGALTETIKTKLSHHL